MTLTTEQLKERLKQPRTGTEFELITEVLRYRETLPVAEVRLVDDFCGCCQYPDVEWLGQTGNAFPVGTKFYTAPPAPVLPTTVNFSENSDADMCRTWAWERVKEMVTTDSWDAGDSANFFAFFCWGWDMRRQYNEQRPPAVPRVTEIPEAATLTNINQLCPLDNNLSQTDFATGWNDCRQYAITNDGVPPVAQGWHSAAQGWNACRAAMLAAAPENH
ncbi:TPA: hypothetical protein SMI12_001065 [Serratia liquefaciens]|nr:hypothetical protein [Serratia liquefaciens]